MLAAAGTAVVSACGILVKDLRPRGRGTTLRFARLGLAGLLLLSGLEILVFAFGISLVARYPEWVPVPPITGLLAYWLGHAFDERRGVGSATKEQPRHPPHISDGLAGPEAAGPQTTGISKPLMGGHLSSLLGFYVGSRQVRIRSSYDSQQALSRVMQLKDRGEVCVWRKSQNKLVVARAHHGSRANILPLFSGSLTDCPGGTVLEGHIQIDPGLRIVIGLFCFLFLLLPIGLISRVSVARDVGTSVIGFLIVLAILELSYFVGRDDPAVITRNLEQALNR
jgi:hypothetical protein